MLCHIQALPGAEHVGTGGGPRNSEQPRKGPRIIKAIFSRVRNGVPCTLMYATSQRRLAEARHGRCICSESERDLHEGRVLMYHINAVDWMLQYAGLARVARPANRPAIVTPRATSSLS